MNKTTILITVALLFLGMVSQAQLIPGSQGPSSSQVISVTGFNTGLGYAPTKSATEIMSTADGAVGYIQWTDKYGPGADVYQGGRTFLVPAERRYGQTAFIARYVIPAASQLTMKAIDLMPLDVRGYSQVNVTRIMWPTMTAAFPRVVGKATDVNFVLYGQAYPEITLVTTYHKLETTWLSEGAEAISVAGISLLDIAAMTDAYQIPGASTTVLYDIVTNVTDTWGFFGSATYPTRGNALIYPVLEDIAVGTDGLPTIRDASPVYTCEEIFISGVKPYVRTN